MSEGGLNQAITPLGQRALTDEYAEPFRRAITEAGLSVVMNSYNEIDGIPAAANSRLLTELLREVLGFEGMVVGDYDSVDMLRTAHRTASTPGEAARQALSAGLDVELPRASDAGVRPPGHARRFLPPRTPGGRNRRAVRAPVRTRVAPGVVQVMRMRSRPWPGGRSHGSGRLFRFG